MEIVFVERAPAAGTKHRLKDGSTIGRRGACDVQLDDPDVSRRHAMVRRQGPNVVIEDLGSTNGTFVNGARIHAVTALRDGDRVQFGGVEWELSLNMGATRVVPTREPADERETKIVPVQPAPAPDHPPVFAPAEQPFKRSAARRMEATVISYGVVFATAVAVAAYFAQR